MLRCGITATFLLVATCLCSQSPQSSSSPISTTPSPKELFNSLSPSVFILESFNKKGVLVATGSAVSVTANTAITNCHVIQAGTQWTISQGSHQWHVSVIRRNPAHDLCEIDSPSLAATPVVIRDSSEVEIGERVYAIGAPKGLEASLSEGLVSGLREESGGVLIQTTAPISPGSSGGGLFDAEGRLIGITTFGLRNSQNLNFALPSAWVLSLDPALKAVHTSTVAVAHPAPPSGIFELAMESAAKAFDAKDYDKAFSLYSQALEMRPDNVTAMTMVGQLDISRENYSAALALCSRVVSLDADSAEGWSCLGDAYYWQGMTDSAETAFKRAVTLAPGDYSSWVGLGRALFAKGDRDGVLQVYETLKPLNPDIANWFYREVVLKMPARP